MTADQALAVFRLERPRASAEEFDEAVRVLSSVVTAAHRAKAGPHGGQLPLARLRDALDGKPIR